MQCLQLTRGDAPSTKVTLEISGAGSGETCYVTVNGTKYYTATTFEMDVGTAVTVGVASKQNRYTSKITLNGTTVASSSMQTTSASYELTITDNCLITLSVPNDNTYGTAAITMPA